MPGLRKGHYKDRSAPTAPALSAVEQTATSVLVSWSGATDDKGVAGHILEYSADNLSWEVLLYTTTASQYVHTPLADGYHYYRIRAFDAARNYSQYATANILLGQAPSVWPTMSPSYLPIVRDMAGPGLDTPAGSGRNGTGTPVVYYVNSVADTSTGSLETNRGTFRWCLDQHNAGNHPSVILFEVAGRINTTRPYVSKPYLTIAGHTAPQPGIEIMTGATGSNINLDIRSTATDVLVQHLTLRGTAGLTGTNSPLVVTGQNVVIDHMTVANGGDETVSIPNQGSWKNISFLNCIFHDNVAGDYTQGTTQHEGSKHILAYGGSAVTAANRSTIMFFGNLFHSASERMPFVGAVDNWVINNYTYNPQNDPITNSRPAIWQISGSYLQTAGSYSIIGNVIRKGPQTTSVIRAVNAEFHSAGSVAYVARNYGINKTTGAVVLPTETGQYPLFINGNTTNLTGRSETGAMLPLPNGIAYYGQNSAAEVDNVVGSVLWTAGSRPSERRTQAGLYDTWTALVISEAASPGTVSSPPLSSSTGTVGRVVPIGPSDADLAAHRPTIYGDGSAPVATRTLTIPDSPHSVAGNGYTNLENWLHAFEDAVL